MPDSKTNAGLSRRSLFKYGLLGAAVLAAGGAVTSIDFFRESDLAAGMRILRERDVHFLRTLIPLLLEDAVSASDMPQAVSSK